MRLFRDLGTFVCPVGDLDTFWVLSPRTTLFKMPRNISWTVLIKIIIFLFRKIVYTDLQSIAPEQYMKQITKRLTELKAVSVS